MGREMGRNNSNLKYACNKIGLSKYMYNWGDEVEAYLEGFLKYSMVIRGAIMNDRWGRS